MNLRPFAWRGLLKNSLITLATISLAIFCGHLIANMYLNLNPKSHSKFGDYSIHQNNRKFEVTLYGTSTCGYCAQTRELLTKNNIQFNDIIIDKNVDDEKLFSLLNENVVPILTTKKRIVIGFYPAEFMEALEYK